jgi:thioredoxin-like negative regulator of GroEL
MESESALPDMGALFERAIQSVGQEYLRAEQALRQAGAAAEPTLRRNLTHPDPVAGLTARVLLDWAGERAADYEAALRYLDSLPAYFERTAAAQPPIRGVAAELARRLGPRAAELLALRLAKDPDPPHWRVMATLMYLREQRPLSASAALIRFAAQTPNERWRTAVIDVLRALGDPALGEKIAAERRHVEGRGGALPPTLAALERSGPARA